MPEKEVVVQTQCVGFCTLNNTVQILLASHKDGGHDCPLCDWRVTTHFIDNFRGELQQIYAVMDNPFFWFLHTQDGQRSGIVSNAPYYDTHLH